MGACRSMPVKIFKGSIDYAGRWLQGLGCLLLIWDAVVALKPYSPHEQILSHACRTVSPVWHVSLEHWGLTGLYPRLLLLLHAHSEGHDRE